MKQQRMIDREKVEKWFDRNIQNNDFGKGLLSYIKNELLSADIYADPQPEPKWHWEEITADNLPKYYCQEVEVLKDDGNFGHTILRGYRPDKERPVVTDSINLVFAWEKARVKVYEE